MAKIITNRGDKDCKSYLYGKTKKEIIKKIIRLRADRKVAMGNRDHIQAIRLDAIIKRWQLIVDKDDSNKKKWEGKGR